MCSLAVSGWASSAVVYDDDEPRGTSATGPAHRGVCGKAVYASEGAAKRAMRLMMNRGKGRVYAGRLHPYRCPECRGKWHLGHTYRGE